MTVCSAFFRRAIFQRVSSGTEKIFRAKSARSVSIMAQITATPQVGLVDDKISITARGLVPQQVVTVTAVLEERGTFSSCAHFVADNEGCLDLTSQVSRGGTYTGVDGMGLLWSLRPAIGQRKTRLIKADVTQPFRPTLSLLDGQVEWEDMNKSQNALASTSIERWYKGDNVRRVVIRDGAIRGTLFLPPGEGPFPGVIDLFGSTGGLVEFRAALLASRGFAAFALGYLAYEDLPQEMTDIDFDYLLHAVDWFSENTSVQPGGVGIMGVSKGGELGMFMAINSPKVKAVVCVNAAQCYTFIDLLKGGKFFHKGVPLNLEMVKISDDGIHSKGCYPGWKDCLIPVWESDAHFLMLFGEEDQTWDTSEFQETFKRVDPEKRKRFQVKYYPGAGHLLEPPYTPLCYASYHKLVGVNIVWGGSPKQHAEAQEDAWSRSLNFLRKHLGHGHGDHLGQGHIHEQSRL